MDKIDLKIEFMKLLIENDESKLKDFLIINGKSPKVICPILFVDKDKEMEE